MASKRKQKSLSPKFLVFLAILAFLGLSSALLIQSIRLNRLDKDFEENGAKTREFTPLCERTADAGAYGVTVESVDKTAKTIRLKGQDSPVYYCDNLIIYRANDGGEASLDDVQSGIIVNVKWTIDRYVREIEIIR